MNSVQIDLTIKMGDTCEKTMSFNEARTLYEALKPIFDNTGSSQLHYQPGVRSFPEPVYDGGMNVNTPEEYIERQVVEPMKAPNAQDVAEKSGSTTGSGQPMMPPPNLKVEAARARAAERTRGCGK